MTAVRKLKDVDEMNESDKKDPSENVLRLVNNAVERSDSLRNQGFENMEKRLNELFSSMNLRLEKEVDRIDENRKGDIDNVKIANDRAIKLAETLQQEVSRSAETLRDSVAKTAEVISRQFSQVTEEVTKRIAFLEKSQYENQGKSLSAPDLNKMVCDLVKENNINAGKQSMSTPLLMALCTGGGGIVVYIALKLMVH